MLEVASTQQEQSQDNVKMEMTGQVRKCFVEIYTALAWEMVMNFGATMAHHSAYR